MLSLSVVKGAGAPKLAEYYTKEYTQGTGEMSQTAARAAERSRWFGDGASARGLSGSVDQDELLAVLEGKDPNTGQLMFDPNQMQLLKIQRNLGIDRQLGAEDIQSLREGLNPETKQPLPRITNRYVENLFSGRRGMDRSVSAIDMTLSAPKSVSLMMAVGDEELRQAASAAHEAAVDKALKFVQAELLAVRRGEDGKVQEQADQMTAALVTQLASRNHDPQLHTHCVLSAAARGSDGRVSAINATTIHQASKIIGSVYQQELRHQLTQELGVSWEVRPNGLGEMKELPQDVLRQFSSRSMEIDESIDAIHADNQRLLRDVELRLDVYERAADRVRRDPELASEEDKERAEKLDKYHKLLKFSYKEGKYDGSRRKLVNALTRQAKDEPAEEELRETWEEQWARSGVAWTSVLARSQRVREGEVHELSESEDPVRDFRQRLEDALVIQNATFGRREAITTGLAQADPSWSSERTVVEVDAFLSNYAVQIREDTAKYANWTLGGGARYTTERVLQQEKEVKEMASRMLDRDDSAVCDLGVTADKSAEYTLNDEQEELMAAMTVSGQQLVMARGIAGSGKTHVLGASASVLQAEGYQVVGLATAAATAQRLSSESGFDRSSSIDRFLTLAQNNKWERGTSPELLAQRAELQQEKRELTAKFSAMEAEAGDDGVQLDAIAEERAAAMESWQKRWDNWLKSAGKEIKIREEVGASLDERRATLDAFQAELTHRQQVAQSLPADERQKELDDIQKGREQLQAARDRWQRDTAIYRDKLSPTEELPHDNRVVLVVDEAGMVETDHYHRLLKLAEERDWKLAFVGDDRQLQEVNRGGSFRQLVELGGSVELGTARRARNAWEQQAQRKWWASEDPNVIKEVADAYIENDRVTFVTDRVVRTAIASERIDPDQLDPKQVEREVARQLMVNNYLEDYDKGIEHLLIAGTRDDVFALNNSVQNALIERGVIKGDGPVAQAADVRERGVAGHYELREGGKIMIMKNVAGTPVKNGMTGVVDRVNGDGGVTVKLPTGPEGNLRSHTLGKDLLDAGYVAEGHAVTAHKSQGMSVENATMLADSSVKRQMLYPGATRARNLNKIVWLVDEDGPAPEEQLAQGMTRSGRKLTALESWSKAPTTDEINSLVAELQSEGITLSPEEAEQSIAEQRRQEYLQAKQEAEQRDEHISRSHNRLEEQKKEQVLQQAQVRQRDRAA